VWSRRLAPPAHVVKARTTLDSCPRALVPPLTTTVTFFFSPASCSFGLSLVGAPFAGR